MKMIIALVGMFIMLLGSVALAGDCGADGHCKKTMDQHCDKDKTAASQHDHSGHAAMHHGSSVSKEKLDWAGMSKHMVPMTKTISSISQRLSELMASAAAGKKMAELGGLMDEMSTHLLRMADAMNNGGATETEMHSIHMGIDETAKKVEKTR